MQNFGRPPAPAGGNKHEYNLWHRICKAWKSGSIAEVQYRSVTSAAKDDDMGEAISKLYEELALVVQDFLQKIGRERTL